jgi:hypothetical protein
MGLTFSGRTKRPDFTQLNNNNYYTNRFSIQKGNPNLLNEAIYQLEYYLKYNVLDMTFGYVYKKDPIELSMNEAADNSSLTVMTFANYADYRELNAMVTANLAYKKIESMISAGLMQPFFTVTYLGEKTKRNQTRFSLQWVNDILLPKETIVSLHFVYQGKSNYYVIKQGEYKMLDLGIRKTFFDKRLSVNLQVSDVFKWITDKTRIEVNHFSYYQQSIFETRYITFTISYHLNNYKEKPKNRSVAGEDILRL